MGTTGNTEIGQNQSKMEEMGGERRSMTNCELAEEGNGNRDVGGNLVLGEGNPLFSGQICGSLE